MENVIPSLGIRPFVVFDKGHEVVLCIINENFVHIFENLCKSCHMDGISRMESGHYMQPLSHSLT